MQFLLRVDNLALLSLFYRYITTAIVLVLCFYFIQVQVHDGGNGYSSKIVSLLYLHYWRASGPNGWITELAEAINCDNKSEFSVETFKKPVKSVLVKHLYTAYQTTSAHVRTFLEIKEDMEELKSDLIRRQSTVIKLQAELLEIKSNQLESVHSTVKTAVQDTVQAGIITYSQAVSKAAPALTEESLKKVVQNVVSEEDRTKNVLIFGFEETSEENLSHEVSEMFQQIEEKPHFEAVRVGKKSEEKIRPVKVSFGNSSTVHQILVKAKELRLIPDPRHKTVFISPDWSPEERTIHQQLVLEMKQIAKEDPDKHYYIRSGKICCKDKVLKWTIWFEGH